jgi:Tol biopolymer transport system component
MTFHSARVSHPVLLDERTLLYLATDPDGSGPWLYSMDLRRHTPHRLTLGPDRYTSLSASADGRRLVLTLATPKRTLWRMSLANPSAPVAIPLTTSSGFSPRLGPNYLIYFSGTGKGDSLWKLQNGTATELWKGEDARVIGGPAISRDGKSIAFAVQQEERTLLYTMQADGTNARVLAGSLHLHGDPSWAPDGESVTVAAENEGMPRLYRVPLDGSSPTAITAEYSTNPAWDPSGTFVLYSGADVGTKFKVRAINSNGQPRQLPDLSLTRGARHLVFLPKGDQLLVLQGEIQHKNLALIDLRTGAERTLSNPPGDFDIRDFDLSPDGQEVVLERVQDRSDIVLLELRSSERLP